jgi:hypothetical protein
MPSRTWLRQRMDLNLMDVRKKSVRCIRTTSINNDDGL